MFKLIYGEFCLQLRTEKNYLFNSILSYLVNLIVLIGFITFAAANEDGTFFIDFSFFVMISSWFLLTVCVGSIVLDVENEIRLDQLRNTLHQKTLYATIMLCRIITRLIHVLLVYLLPVTWVLIAFGYLKNEFSISINFAIYYMSLTAVASVFLSYLFITLVLYLKRISAASGIFNYYLLFFSGLVFVDAANDEPIFLWLNSFVLRIGFSGMLLRSLLFLVTLGVAVYFSSRVISKKIRRL